MQTDRPGDPNAGRDHARLAERTLWPIAAVAFRRLVPARARPAVLRTFGATVGDGVVIESGVRIRRPWLVRVDGPAWVGEGSRIEHGGPVTVERDVCLAPGARIGTGTRDRTPITVGSGSWIGADARVLPGTTIGRRAVLAERAVVGGRVEDGTTVTVGDMP